MARQTHSLSLSLSNGVVIFQHRSSPASSATMTTSRTIGTICSAPVTPRLHGNGTPLFPMALLKKKKKTKLQMWLKHPDRSSQFSIREQRDWHLMFNQGKAIQKPLQTDGGYSLPGALSGTFRICGYAPLPWYCLQ